MTVTLLGTPASPVPSQGRTGRRHSPDGSRVKEARRSGVRPHTKSRRRSTTETGEHPRLVFDAERATGGLHRLHQGVEQTLPNRRVERSEERRGGKEGKNR